MIQVRLYGKLRRYAGDAGAGHDVIVRVDPGPDETIASLLERLGIAVDEVYSVFFNHRLLVARNAMARWLGYQQVRADPFDWNLDVAVKSGDRIGLFGRDMSQLVV